jgi:3-hydroxyacyl-CoA dehydrogenase
LITHFFNPPRRMRLLELVGGPRTRPEAVAVVTEACDLALGKSVVTAKDTPGFVGNRIGVFWMLAALHETIALGLDVEEADAVLGKPFGIPSTGLFGLLDLVGIDLIASVVQSFRASLPPGDPMLQYAELPPVVANMVAAGRIGRKGGGGFYRLSADRSRREAIDLKTGEYRAERPAVSECLHAVGGVLSALVADPGRGGRLAAAVMGRTLLYAAALAPEIADTPADVDEAMRLGYGWAEGPFELADRLGAAWLVNQSAALGQATPPLAREALAAGGFYTTQRGRRACLAPDGRFRTLSKPEGVFRLADHKRTAKPVEDASDATLWDIGDGVGLIEIHTKLNTLGPGVLEALDRFTDHAPGQFRALVIGSDQPYFSGGADLKVFVEAARVGPERFAGYLRQGQQVFRKIKCLPIPVVAAAAGAAVGGGCELLMHCAAVQAHAELNVGLVETKIGVIPGWGGCKELMLRLSEPGPGRVRGPVAPAQAAFDAIGFARVSTSALDARAMGFLRESDGITMNLDRLLADARTAALRLAEGYAPSTPRQVVLAGSSGASALCSGLDGAELAGRLSPHDRVVGEALIGVLTGGPTADPTRPEPEDVLFDLEREAFLKLYATPAAQDRVKHMLTTRKPLRN